MNRIALTIAIRCPTQKMSTTPKSDSSTALGDFNNDGSTDIVVQQYDVSTEFSILLGNGDGTFQNPQVLSTSIFPGLGKTVADFNNDGLLDFSMPSSDYYVYLQK